MWQAAATPAPGTKGMAGTPPCARRALPGARDHGEDPAQDAFGSPGSRPTTATRASWPASGGRPPRTRPHEDMVLGVPDPATRRVRLLEEHLPLVPDGAGRESAPCRGGDREASAARARRAVRHLAGHARRRRAGSLRVAEDMDPGQVERSHEGDRALQPPGPPWEAHDQVRVHRHLRDSGPDACHDPSVEAASYRRPIRRSTPSSPDWSGR